jgi:glycosyltransferase involved in cell wall biosynthesis
MKILFLTQYLSATRGGGEVVFDQWSKELSRRGHIAFIVCHKMKKVDMSSNGVNVFSVQPMLSFNAGRSASFKQNIQYLINSIRISIKLVKKYDVDVIHGNNFMPTISGHIISKLTHRPLVCTIHDVFSNSIQEYWKTWYSQFGKPSFIKLIVGPLVEKLMVNIPSTIHTVSNQSKKDILQFGTNRSIVVIANGLEPKEYTTGNKEVCETKQLVFIGRHLFYKNLPVVLKALVIVKHSIPDVHLVVIGDGPMKVKWQQLATDLGLDGSVTFEGFVSNEKKLELLRNSRALVFPSTIEGFGLVIIEAFALRKPVVASNLGPMSEIIDDNINGFLVAPNDINSWSSKISFLLNNPQIAKQMGEAGNAKFLTKYTIKNTMDGFEKLYASLSLSRKEKKQNKREGEFDKE